MMHLIRQFCVMELVSTFNSFCHFFFAFPNCILNNLVFSLNFAGIVRAVNKTTNDIYLVSSVGLQDLANVNALALSAIPLPSAVLLNQHSLVRGHVPFVYNTDDFVGSKQVAQHVYKVQGYNRI